MQMKKTPAVVPAVVLSSEKIKQKLAGYLANYNRRLNKAAGKEKRELEASRQEFMDERKAEILEQNRKAVQRRAGYLSWETRKKNLMNQTVENIKEETKKTKCDGKKRYGSSITVCVLNNSKKK